MDGSAIGDSGSKTGLDESPEVSRDLQALLRPRSIAIVGASSRPGSLGARLLANLERAAFPGPVYLVNPSNASIGSRACYPALEHLPESVDCALIAVPHPAVAQTLRDCGKEKIRSAIIFSAGYAETGVEGRAAQDELAVIARNHGMLLLGPNCLGLNNALAQIPLTFVPVEPGDFGMGGVALLSQSGALAAALTDTFRHFGLKQSLCVSTGNEAMLGLEDFLECLLPDLSTSAIVIVAEAVRHPERLIELIGQLHRQGKKIILLHPGITPAGRLAALNHRGAVPRNPRLLSRQATRSGAVVVSTLEAVADVTQILTCCQPLQSGGLGIITESGSFRALSFDRCERLNIGLLPLSPSAEAQLSAVIPSFASPSNPLDLTAQTLVDPDLYRKTLPIMLQERQVGALLISLILGDTQTAQAKLKHIVAGLAASPVRKPLIITPLEEGTRLPETLLHRLHSQGAAFLPSSDRAFRAIARLVKPRL